MLQEQTLFDYRDKVQISIERLQSHEPPEGYYIAFSGGKDSIVTLDLVRRSGVKHDTHMNMTSVDPPELIRFVRKHYPDVEMIKPFVTMWKLIEIKMMPPTRTVRFCCEVLKEEGGGGRCVVTGIRWQESQRRRQRQMIEDSKKTKGKNYLHPIIDWSSGDIWDYIRGEGLPYPSLYDEGFKRIGCIGCPMSTHRKQEFERWPRYEKLYRKAFAAAAAANLAALGPEYGGRGCNARLRWKDGDDMFRWWMEEKRKTNDDQYTLFGE